MPGPPPKDPAIRQRANKHSTEATLRDSRHSVRVPPLPERFMPAKDDEPPQAIPWHPRTIAWWTAVWRSPQAAQFTPVMVYELELLAELRDDFNASRGDPLKLAAEIRMHRRDFALTPLDMRRLGWSIEKPPPKKKPEPVDAPQEQGADPRFGLRAVK